MKHLFLWLLSVPVDMIDVHIDVNVERETSSNYLCLHMKKHTLLSLLGLLFFVTSQAQVSKSIHVTAGKLNSSISVDEKTTITTLKLSGTLNTADFIYIRDSLTAVQMLDLTETKIIKPIDSIPNNAFFHRTTLKSVAVPSGTIYIGKSAFSGCTNLTEVKLPPTIESLGIYAFSNSGITSIELPATFSQTSGSCFSNCVNLEKATIPHAIGMFSGNYNLKTIVIPDGVTQIREGAFSQLTSMSKLSIPSTVSSIGANAFNNCIQLDSVSIPEGVTFIGMSAFAGCNNLKTLVLPESLIVIKTLAFANCNSLTTVKIPIGATSVESAAFKACTGLNTIITMTSQGAYGGDIFDSCSNIKTIIIPDGASLIKDNAFSIVYSIVTSVIIPSSVTKIGNSALRGCIAIETITLPEKIYSIGSYAFAGCSGLKTLEFPVSLNQIGTQAFMGCTGLSSIDVPGTTTVASGAFQNCTGLVMATISAANYSGSIFPGCTQLKTIVIPQGVNSIRDYAFSNCNTLDSISIPSTVWQIGYGAFQNCSSLKSIHLPASIQSIPDYCFRQCTGLASIVIPANVTTIGSGAFWGCSGLKSITVENSFPVDLIKTQSVFPGEIKSSCSLNVPYKTKSRYAGAFQWNEFANIVEKSTGVYVNSNKVDIAPAAGSFNSVELYANVEWTAKSNQSWLTVSPLSGTGNAVLTFTTDNAVIEWNRRAYVTVSSPGYNDQVIEIYQKLLPKTVNITAGGLQSALTSVELKNLTTLTVTGTMDARDFITIRDNMPLIENLDLSAVTISMYYIGPDQPYNSANSIPANAFYNSAATMSMVSLKSVLLPKTITSIGYSAFRNCTLLTSVNIPVGVRSIDQYAFYNCNGLSSVYVNTNVPIDLKGIWSAFVFNAANCTLYVPYASKALYTSAEQWKNFTNIVEAGKGFMVGVNKLVLQYDDAGKVAVDVKSNVSWTATSNQSWLTLSPASGSGNAALAFIVENNQTTTTKKAIVTISAPDFPDQTIEVTQNIAPKTIDIVAGGLYSALTADELNFLSSVVLTGSMDARDFKTLRDKMPLLTTIDLSEVEILAYTGSEGTIEGIMTYPFNTIPRNAFNINNRTIGKETLQTIVLPSKLSGIGYGAFLFCTGLKSISIPGTVNSIGNYAFGYCSGLTSIYVHSLLPDLFDAFYTVFDNVNMEACTLYVPYKSRSLYSIADGWKFFRNIVENQNGFMVGNNAVKLHYSAGSTAVIDISANVPWSIVTDQPWISLSSISGTSDTKLTITVGENESTDRRYGSITFSSPGFASHIVNVTQTGAPLTVDIKAGSLSTVLTQDQLNFTSDLTITGTLDVRDFKTMRDLMPELTTIDLKETVIVAYSGQGTDGYFGEYKDDTVPPSAFFVSGSNQGKTGLVSIKLPSSVKGFGNSAFMNCKNLTSFYVYAIDPIDLSGSSYLFDGTNMAACTLYVPYGTKPFYASAYYWKNFGTIMEAKTGFLVETKHIKLRSDEGRSAKIGVKANIQWTVSSDQAWLKVQPITSTGNDTITVMAESNTTPTVRKATVTVTAPGEMSQTINVIQAGAARTIHTSAGELHSAFTSEDAKTLSELTITGNIDARDFFFMRDSMPMLTYLDISQVKVVACVVAYTNYYADAIPWEAFAFTGTSTERNRLTSIKLPTTVAVISDRAFKSCADLTYISIPNSVKTIGESAFSLCTSLPEIILPDSILKIGAFAFHSCIKVKTITIPPLVTSIGEGAFIDCKGLTSIYAQPDVPVNLANYTIVFASVDVLNCVLNVPFGQKALYAAAPQWKNFSNIVENTNGMLLSKSNLNVPNKVTGTITVGVTSNGSWAVSSDKEWVIVSPLNAVGNDTITVSVENNPSMLIRSAIITVTTNGAPSKKIIVTQGAESKILKVDAGGLFTALTIKERQTISYLRISGTIDARDFKTMRDSMPLLSTLDMSDVRIVQYIGNKGPDQTSTMVNYEAHKIPQYAFFNNVVDAAERKLTSVVLPASVTVVGVRAFKRCVALENISLQNSVTTISSEAFSDCNRLNNVTMSNSLTAIGAGAFKNCPALKNISIPASVVTIQSGVFDLSGITTIYAYPILPVMNTGASGEMFSGLDKANCTLYVPQGSKQAYQTAYEWKDFGHIFEMTTATPTLDADQIHILVDPNSNTFRCIGLEGKYRVSVYDMNARLLFSALTQTGESISTDGFPKGMYIVRLITDNAVIEKKVLKY